MAGTRCEALLSVVQPLHVKACKMLSSGDHSAVHPPWNHSKACWGRMLHRDISPSRIVVEPQVHVVLESQGQAVHEGRPRRDSVAVPCLTSLWFGYLDTLQHSAQRSDQCS